MASSFRLVRVATVLFALLASGRSAWAQWTPDGVSVLFGPIFVATVGAASDLNGGAYVGWETYGSVSAGYVQRVLADGTIDPAWPAGGNPVCDGAWTRYATTLISDDQGGAYVAWLDDRSPPPDSARVFAVYLTRFSFGGRVPGWSPDGTALSTIPRAYTRILLTHDTFGGVFAAWSEAGESATRLMHMDADAKRSSGWPAEGVVLNGGALGIAPDAQGGVFAWTGGGLFHVGWNGGAAPGWPVEGLVISPRPLIGPSLTSDDSGGVYCVWSQSGAVPDTTDGAYAQRIRFDGSRATGWPDAGVRLSHIPATTPMSLFGLQGGSMASWISGWGGAHRVVAQKIDPAGVAPGWPSDGVMLGDFFGTAEPQGISDGRGGAYIGWESRSVQGVQCASLQHVLGDGRIAFGWPQGGIPLLPSQGFSGSPYLAGFTGPAIVAWTNPVRVLRRTFVRAARVTDVGPSISAIRPLRAVPNATGVRLEWFLATEAPVEVTVERQDRLGWRPIGTVEAGFGVLGFTDTQVRPGSSYRYRLSIRVAGVASSFAEMEVTIPFLRLRIRAAPANPVRGELAAEVQLPHTAPAILELFDARGRLVERQEIAGGAPRVEQFRLGAGRRLASGVYFFRVTQEGQSAGKRVVFIR